MIRIILPMFFAAIITGCVVVKELLEPPAVETDKGKACVRDCQSNHSECTLSCNNWGTVSMSNCINGSCRPKLEQCYATCEED